VKGALVEIETGNRSFNVSVDPDYRIALTQIEITGRGAPPLPSSPAPGFEVPLLAGALVLVAALRRRSP